MKKIILFDTHRVYANLLPLSFTRPVSDFRVGITTIREKWSSLLPGDYSLLPVGYLRERFSVNLPAETDDILFIAGNILPDEDVAARVDALGVGEAFSCDGELLAFRGGFDRFHELVSCGGEGTPTVDLRRVRYVFDIFLRNPEMVREDFFRLTDGRVPAPLPASNTYIGPYEDECGRPLLFIEEGASVEGATINTKGGPIYIGEDVEIMEGVSLRGPIAFCRHSQARIGAKLYDGSTFGPYCKVGGEVANTVMFGYSNKSHDGYLGNAVIGEWCNIGAGTNASNLKNDYSKIRIWNYASKSFMRTDLQFCGLIMGDHSKAGVNCMFNTATVLGVGVNVHGAGFPRVFVPSFSEGSATAGFTDVPMKKFEQIAARVMARRGIEVTDEDRAIFERIRKVASMFKG